jgi:hypothetical protein
MSESSAYAVLRMRYHLLLQLQRLRLVSERVALSAISMADTLYFDAAQRRT